jgi:chemotaxis protein CheD
MTETFSSQHEPPQMIGIGEYRVGSSPMMTIGLGSCIGLILYDREREVGAMVHIMLPESAGRTDRPGKYADTAIPLLVKELAALGCRKQSLIAKMAGGACMFEYFGTNLNIGGRNAEKIRAVLAEQNIKLAAEDVGGRGGRSVTFFPSHSGKVMVRVADGTSHEI